jgi:hypothetical protein
VTAALAPAGSHCSRAAPAGASAGENSFARILAQLPDLRGFRPSGSGRPGGVSLHPGWSPVSCWWRQAGWWVSAGCADGADTGPLRQPGRVCAPGLTWANGWQVQDSNLGRLSSAILQTVAGTALNWTNIGVRRRFGTYLTSCHRTNRTHSPFGSSFTDHVKVRVGRTRTPSANLQRPPAPRLTGEHSATRPM